MGKKLLHMALAVIAAVLPTIPSMAQIPEGYYSSLKGKKGAELKTAVYNVIKNAKVLSYGSGSIPGGDFGRPTVTVVATSSTDILQKATG